MTPWPGSTNQGPLGCARGKVWLNPAQVVGEQVLVHMRWYPSPLFHCPPMQKGAARTMPRRYCPLFTRSHLDMFCLFV